MTDPKQIKRNKCEVLPERVLIIDQLNLFFRSYIVNPSLSKNGDPIGGLMGSIKSLQKVIRETSPDKVVICWDGPGGSKKRKLVHKEYKAGRKPLRLNRDIRHLSEDEEMKNKIWQQTRLIEYFEQMPVIQLMYPDIEADDIIAYVARMPAYKGKQKIILSSDKDFFQLLDNETILNRPIQKEILNKNMILEKFGIHPTNFTLARAMVGDRSDNLEGVGGIGLATVTKRFPFLSEEKTYSLEDIISFSKKRFEETNMKAYSNLLDKKDIFYRNYKMMQLYSPSLSIGVKKSIKEICCSETNSFSKTEIRKMMIQDGFGDYDWSSLFQNFNRMTLKK